VCPSPPHHHHRLVLAQNKKELLTNWWNEGKLEASEDLGDMVSAAGGAATLPVCCRVNLCACAPRSDVLQCMTGVLEGAH
jgi:hypothetical protein